MSNWEHQYREEVSGFTSPQQLDTQVLQQARELQPKKDIGRMLSKASLGCATIAAILMLVHPAQHLGALTPGMTPDSENRQPALEIAQWQPPEIEPEPQIDPWQALRDQVTAGNFVALCQEWRGQQNTTEENSLPRELRRTAQKRCRILP